MTAPRAHPPEAAWVEQVAASYRASGYRVVLAPAPGELPAFLFGYAPDLVAEREGEHVLVERS